MVLEVFTVGGTKASDVKISDGCDAVRLRRCLVASVINYR